MIITYAPGLTRNVPLPETAFWRASTPDNAGHWYSRTVNRSALLQALDRAIATFQALPTLANFANIEMAHANWRRTKLNAQGQVVSRRAVASNHLNPQLAAHRAWLTDCATVMARVEAGLGALPWKTHTLCAELYGNENNVHWAPLEPRDIQALALEQTATSRWAQNVPVTVDGWRAVGAGERARLLAWPNLAQGNVRLAMNAALGINANVPGQWPPWQNRLPVLPPAVANPPVAFVRKGLFCHSYAALAAEYLYTNRLALVAGTGYRIHSIDLIHQQPPPGGLMSHWWVCVNGPTAIQYTPAGPLHTFTHCQDFVDHLELAGGFVVDMWGSLWADQNPAGQNPLNQQRAHLCAVNAAATAGACVLPIPEIVWLGNTATISRARQAWF